MKSQLSLTVRTKLSLLVTVLLQTVLFFALIYSSPLVESVSASNNNIVQDNLIVYLESNNPNSLETQSSDLGNGINGFRWNDLSGNNNDFHVINSVISSETGQPTFNGTNGYMVSENKIQFSGLDSTFEMWVNINSDGNGVLLGELGQYGLDTSWHYAMVEIQNNDIYAGVWGGRGYDEAGSEDRERIILASNSLIRNKLQHIAYIYRESSKSLELYLNGNLILSKQLATDRRVPDDRFYQLFGIDSTELIDGGYLEGSISRLRIYNDALTEEEIKRNYISDSLQVHKVFELNPFLEASYAGTGSTISNTARSGLTPTLNGTINNNPEFTRPYFSFDSNTESISVPDHALIEPTTNDFSVEAWIRPNDVELSQVVLMKIRNGVRAIDISYGIRIRNGDIRFDLTNRRGEEYPITSGVWNHVVGVFKNNPTGKVVELYLNGILVQSGTHNLTTILDHSNPLYIGNYNNNEYQESFKGDIGKVAYYNNSISASGVELLYNQGLSDYVHTISFSSNGGSGSIQNIIATPFSNITISRGDFAKDGFFFDSFNDLSNGLGQSYSDNATFTVPDTTSTTLYAQWLPSYDRYDSGIIRIDETKVEDNLTNFPVTIVLNSGNFDFSKIQSSGADVFFTDMNHNLLPFEVDYVNIPSGIAVYHVLYSGIIEHNKPNQEILIRFGQVDGHFYDFSQGHNPTDVWDENYVLVMHMGEELKDSTSRYNTTSGVHNIIDNLDNPTSILSSPLGLARGFNGDDQFIELESPYLINNASLPGEPRSFVVFFNSNSANLQQLISFRGESFNEANTIAIVNQNDIHYSQYPPYNLVSLSGNLLNQQNGYLVGLDGSTNGVFNYAFNETFGSTTFSNPNFFNRPNKITIGADFTSPTLASRWFSGYIDEIRISDTVRTEHWLKAEYYALRGQLANPVYTVTFDSNDGDSVADVTEYAGTSLSDGTRTGYTFDGWFLNDDTITLTPAEDVTLTAQWTPMQVVVSFDNSGAFVSSGFVTYDSTYGTLPSVSRTGYTFDGWYTASTGGSKVESSTVVNTDSDHTLFARFTPKTFTVTFVSDVADSITPETIIVTYDDFYTLASASRDGYSLVGWFDDSTQILATTVVAITEDQTLTAEWVAEEYVVTFDQQSGTGGTDSGLVTFDSPLPNSFTTPSRTGYAFDGYFLESSGLGVQYYNSNMEGVLDWNISSDTTLYANWTPITITTSFSAEGGTVSPTSQVVTFDAAYGILPTPQRSGYSFVGWYTQASGGSEVNSGTIVSNAEPHTVYARWSEISYTITYNVDNGTLTNAIHGFSVTSGTITLPTTIVRTYYRFAGWYDNAGFNGNRIESFESTEVGNKVFYAKWIEDSTTTIKIPAAKIDTTLTNFPLTIVLTDDNFDFTGIQASGIYFTDANQTLLDFEVESVRLSPRRYVYHVRIPSVSHTVDTIVNIRASQEIDYSLGNNPLGVWDSNYVFVSHMGSTLKDSTGNVTTLGTNFGTTVVDTPFGEARRFNGTNQYILFDQMGPLTQMVNSSMTVVALAFLSEQPNTTFRLIANTGAGWDRQGFFFATDSIGIRNQMGTDNSETIWYAPSLKPSSNNWQLIGMGYNASTKKQVSYLDTSMQTNTATFNGIYDYRKNAKLNIGAGKAADSLDQSANSNVISARFFKGDLAEFRISNISRSQAWVKAEYYSLTNNLIVFAGRPVLTLIGDTIVDVPVGTSYTDSGVTAVSAEGTLMSLSLVTSGSTVNTNVLGVYNVTYSVAENGITVQAVRTVRVVDITPPVVSLIGPEEVFIPYDSVPYVIQDSGLTITDDYDTTLSWVFYDSDDELTTLDQLVDVTVLGSTTVTYVVRDNSGNMTTTTRTFTVRDEVPPVVTLRGNAIIQVELGTSYTDEGIEFSDNYSLPAAITVTSGVNGSSLTPVNTNLVGDYIISYVVTDENQNQTTVTRLIEVRDTIAPVITLNGLASVRILYGTTYTDAGVTVTDVSGSITPIVDNPVDTFVLGTYTITYDAVDPSGNLAIQITREVEVYDDVLPAITGVSNASINADQVHTFTLPIPTITDNTGVIASSGVEFFVTDGMTPLSTIEEVRAELFAMRDVTIRYTATDPSGNSRVVNITRTPIDNILPTFSGLTTVGVTTPELETFTLPIPTIIDNDPNTTYTVRALLGAASANSLTLLRPNQIGSITGLSFCDINTNTCTIGTNSPVNEGPGLVFDQRQNTKYLNRNKFGAGVQFTLDQVRSLDRIVFRTANDVDGRDPMTYVLQGRNSNNEWVTISTGNTGLSTNRFALGPNISLTGSAAYQTYRVFFPTIRNANANSMQIADIFLYVSEIVTTTDLATIQQAILSRVPVTLEYTAFDPAGNETVVTLPVQLINFIPRVNPNVSLPFELATANQPFTFNYPSDPMIDLDDGEVLTYSVEGLPPGLEFDASTMSITGEPTLVSGLSIEDYEVTLTATDAELATVTRTHTIRVYYVAQIQFESNGGTAVTTQTNIISQPLPAEPIPFLRGYTFEGWFTEATFLNSFDWDGVMPEVNQTLYAKWSPTVYTITYVDGGATDGFIATYTVESPDITLSRPSRTGLIFGGWSDNGFIPQNSIGNRTFTASWIPRNYTLTLLADGRQVSRSSIPFGSSLANISVGLPPARTGYDAVGWNQDLPSTMPADNITLTAVYVVRSYTFTALDDEGNELARSSVNFNAAVPYPANPTKEGFTFVRWSVSPASMPASDLSVSAVFAVAQYVVTFVDDEGNNLGTENVDFGAAVTAIEPPEKEGFVFVEWTGLPETMPAAAVTVTAVYEAVEPEEEPLIDEEEEPGEEDEESPELLAPAIPTLPNRRPTTPIIIPEVVLPPNPDPVVTRVSVNGVDLDVSIIPGQPVGELPQAVLDGYLFQGWMNAITGEMITPETVINNPDFVVLVPLFEKAPSLIDAARSVFQTLIANPFNAPTQTNDLTTRTDNIQTVRADAAATPPAIELQGGLEAVFNPNGSVTIPLSNEQIPITLRVQGLDALTTAVYYYIGEGAPEFDASSWRPYSGEPFLSAKQGDSVFMMVKDAFDTHQVSYLKPATFIENPERIPTSSAIFSADDDSSLTNTIRHSFLTKIEYEDTMVDLFMFEPTAEDDLEQVIVRYRANDHNKSLLINVEALTWREEFVTLGNSLGVYLRSGDNLAFEVEYQFKNQASVVESFQLSFEGESIGVFLAVSPNAFLRAMLGVLVLSTLIAPYLLNPKPKQNMS
jgi:uncharacterized repeat protein (TIGR02543 family)